MATVAALSADLTLRTASFTRNLDVAQRHADSGAARIRRSFTTIQLASTKLQQSVGLLRQAMVGLAGPLGVGLIGAGALGFIKQQAAMADALAHTADRLGVTTTQLQKFRFAADQAAGVSQGAADLGLQRFTRRLAEAQQGAGELVGVLRQYNIALRNADGTARSADEVLGDYAETVKNASSSQEQLRLAFKAFDSEGAALVNLLRRGRDGLDEFGRKAEEAGAVLDEQTVRKLAEANTTMAALATTTRNNLTMAMADLAPVLVSAARGLATMTGWLRTAYEEIVNLSAGIPWVQLDMAQNRLAEMTAERQRLQAEIAAIEAQQPRTQASRNIQDRQLAAREKQLAEVTASAIEAKAEVDRLTATTRELDRSLDPLAAKPTAVPGLPEPEVIKQTTRAMTDLEKQIAAINERARQADEAANFAKFGSDTFADYDAAVAAQIDRERAARQKAAQDVAAARTRSEAEAQRQIDRLREQAHREAIRNAENLADTLVTSGRDFLESLTDQSRDFWQDFADFGKAALLDIAAEQLFRAPANAFAAGLFGTGGATGGANAGGIAGLAGSIGQSLATSAISDAIGLPSIGSILGFGGGGGAAAALPAFEAAVALTPGGTGLGAGLFGLGAVGGPLALGGLALGGAALLGGFGQKESVGPNASARLVLDNNRFRIGPTGSDNGGEQFLGQAKAEAQAAADVLNRIITELGLTVDDVPSSVELATAFGDQFNRTGRNLAEDVIRSGALGDLTDEQLVAALGGQSLFAAQVEAVRQALRSAGVAEAMREAARIVDQAAREQEAADRQRLVDQLGAAREQLDAQEDLVAALDDAARAFADAAETLAAGVDQLLLSAASPLSPAARLAEAQQQFDAAVAAGDAAGAVAAGNALARENASFFGTATTAGASGFNAITSTLRTLEADASARAGAEREALSAAEAQLATLESAVATAEAELAAFGEQNRISAEQLAAAQQQIDLLGQQQAALDAIEAALGTESPDAALLRQQLDVLERVGAGQGAVALAVRDLATAITATTASASGATNVTAIKSAASASAAAGIPAPDAFSAWAAEVQAMRDARFMADGGIVDRPTLAMIGEGAGPEAVIPLKGGAVPVRFEGGRGSDNDMRAGLAALVEVGTETVAELRRLNGRVASLENEQRHRGRERLVGSR